MKSTLSRCYARTTNRTPFGVALAEASDDGKEIHIGVSLVHPEKDKWSREIGNKIAEGRLNTRQLSIPNSNDEDELTNSIVNLLYRTENQVFLDYMLNELKFVVHRASRFYRKHSNATPSNNS